MKKLTITAIVLVLNLFMQAQAQTSINFITEFVPNKPIGNNTPKTPVRPPVVYIDDYTLTFTADHPEYVLTIKNEESEVVYTTVVSSAETQVLLPTTLSGEYQIELAMGNWLFTGWIEL